MAKFTTQFMIALLVSVMLTYAAARPEPSMVNTQQAGDVEIEKNGVVAKEEGCEGVSKEECLVKGTLIAHVDYIYTQSHSPNIPHKP